MIFVLKSNPMLRRAACRDQTAVSCPSNVSNVYNSYNVVTIVQCLQLVQCRAMFAMFTTRTHSLFRCRGYIHMLNTCAFLQCCKCCIPTHNTMDAPTVTNPLVTPFWGLSLVQVINTDLNSTSLFFSSFFSSWKTGFNF